MKERRQVTEKRVREMKGHRRHYITGIAMVTLLLFCAVSLGFAQVPMPVQEEEAPLVLAEAPWGQLRLPVPGEVSLAGGVVQAVVAEVQDGMEQAEPHGGQSIAVVSVPDAGAAPAQEAGEGARVEEKVQTAVPPEARPVPEPGINPPSDLVGVFMPSTRSYVKLDWSGNNHGKYLREFRVYRITAGSEEAVEPAPIGDTKQEHYEDYEVEPGLTYVYWVTAVSKDGEESAPSNRVEVEILQDQPPEPPQGLVAAAIDPGVCLDWTPSGDDNLAGYLVYLVMNNGRYRLLTNQPIADNHYYDRNGAAGYVYAVCAVNLYGTESEYAVARAVVSEPTFFEESNPAVQVDGLWVSEAYLEASGGRILVAGNKGDRLHFHFTGRQVKVISAMYWSCGSAAMYIDGQYITTVDLYNPEPIFGSMTLDVPGLRYGEHTLTIEVLGTGNPETNLYFVNVDAFEVL